MRIWDWAFDAWGGAFAARVPCGPGDRVPDEDARVTGLPINTDCIVHGRGDRNFNGMDNVMRN